MKFGKVLIVCGALALSAIPSFADISQTVDAVATPSVLSSTDFNWSLVFPSTSVPVGYVFVSATLTLTNQVSDTGTTLRNRGTSSSTYSYSEDVIQQVNTNSAGAQFVGSQIADDQIFNLSNQNINGLTTINLMTVNNTNSLSASNSVSAGVGQAYLNGATIAGESVTNSVFSNGGSFVLSDNPEALVTGKLTFDFAPTPEPGFYGMLALGLTGLVSVARRRKNA